MTTDRFRVGSIRIAERRAAPGSQPLADQVSEAWLAFARTGNPNHPGLPDWPAYEQGRRSTMLFDEKCRVVEDPDAEERQAWDHIRSPM